MVKRYYSFDADGRLALAIPPVQNATGREVSTILVWERLRDVGRLCAPASSR